MQYYFNAISHYIKMPELIYPDNLQELFTNPEKKLKLLEFSKE